MDLQLAYDIELEKTIVGTMIAEPDSIREFVKLSPKNFTDSRLRKLFNEAIRLWNEQPDLLHTESFYHFAEKAGIEKSFITDLIMKALPTPAYASFYVQKIEAITALREAGKVAQKLLSAQNLRRPDDIREILNQSEMQMTHVASHTVQKDTLKSLDEVLREVNERFMYNYENKKGITGVPSGFPDLDRATSGFQKGDFIILAARPSMGKSALAINFALNMAIEKKLKVVFFNLEMSQISMGFRMLASYGNLDLKNLMSGKLNEEEFYRYTKTISVLTESKGKNLWLDEQAGLTVPEIKAKARKIQREHGLDCIIIDYLGLIEGIKGEYNNRQEEVARNSRLLKLMAKELDVPVICLCQLSRACEQRNDKRPILSDLRDSGSIEQDADLVMFLYRDDYYNGPQNPEDENQSIAELIIAKHRNGPTGTIELLFQKNYNKFFSLERRAVEQ